jgi:hypothetical protein
MKKYVFLLLTCCLSTAFAAPVNQSSNQVFHYGAIPVVVLSGNYQDMGKSYGEDFKNDLYTELGILENYYMTENHVSYGELVAQSNLLYDRFPYSYQLFLKGVSEGSGLNLSDVKILNAMETLGELVHQSAACAFFFVPAMHTNTGNALIGRNYDYPPPFDTLSQYVSVVILKAPDTVPTAIVGITGEIYCPSCINQKGLFAELNNGTPSGGSAVDANRQSLLINMLSILQNSTNLTQAENQFNALQGDFSLIVNVTDGTQVMSNEYSTTLGMKVWNPTLDTTFVSTNFYLDPDWQNEIPAPTDTTTWEGVTRRDNLLALDENTPTETIASFENNMNMPINDGGAVWSYTIYQLIFDESTQTLYVKINANGNAWTPIPLADLFNL